MNPGMEGWNLRNQLNQSTAENSQDSIIAVKDANYIIKRSQPPSGNLILIAPDSCAPSTPTNLTGKVMSAGEIDLSWTPAPDMDLYTLARTDSLRNQVTLYLPGNAPIGAGNSSYTDKSVIPNSIYPTL